MNKQITSQQNPLIKQLLLLKEKSRERKKSGFFLIEGVREITLALHSNHHIDTLLLCSDLCDKKHLHELSNQTVNVVEISKDIYEKLAYRKTTEGVLALAKSKKNDLDSLQFNHKNPLILIAEAPEKPGNIGALLRTADAAKVDAVIIANPKTDLYNPNIIRSSVGCLFTNTIATGKTTEIIRFLKDKAIPTYCAELKGSTEYHKLDYTGPTALVVGTEAIGLSDEWLNSATQNIIIPMHGKIDSLNVSVAAGILIFEAKRQRDFKS